VASNFEPLHFRRPGAGERRCHFGDDQLPAWCIWFSPCSRYKPRHTHTHTHTHTLLRREGGEGVIRKGLSRVCLLTFFSHVCCCFCFGFRNVSHFSQRRRCKLWQLRSIHVVKVGVRRDFEREIRFTERREAFLSEPAVSFPLRNSRRSPHPTPPPPPPPNKKKSSVEIRTMSLFSVKAPVACRVVFSSHHRSPNRISSAPF
jgi:hypothetical protein